MSQPSMYVNKIKYITYLNVQTPGPFGPEIAFRDRN
jgi:hypothetical protein